MSGQGPSNVERADEYQEIVARLLELEEEYDLFNVRIGGIRIWERLRFGVSVAVLTETGAFSQPHTTVTPEYLTYLRMLLNWVKYSYYRNPMFGPNVDVLIWGVPRRKERDDGRWWDIIGDPIATEIDYDAKVMENPYLLSHRTPTPTHPSYLDFIEYTSKIRGKLGLSSISFSADERASIERLRRIFEREFDVSLDFESRICRQFQQRQGKGGLYRRLLRRTSPDVVFVVASAGKDVFVETCQSEGIPVVELQHGGFGPDHFGYSFPGDRTKETFPDYLFTFGEYWTEIVDFPIPQENVIPVGYPYFEEERAKYEHLEPTNQVVIISQGPKGDIISRFATELSQREAFSHDIVYKLHPGEYDRWRSEYPWLEGADLQIVEGDDPPLYQILAESAAQVGVNSTVLYEGFGFGLDTYILTAPGYTRMQGVFDLDHVSVVESVDEFLEVFSATSTTIDTDRFFRPGAIENVESAIEDIVEN